MVYGWFLSMENEVKKGGYFFTVQINQKSHYELILIFYKTGRKIFIESL